MTQLEQGPGRRALYKYASPKTALAVLSNRTFRYSSPLTFNDPFDIQTELHIGFDTEVLVERLLARVEQLASNQSIEVSTANPWGEAVQLARSRFATHGFPADGWRHALLETMPPLVEAIQNARSQYREAWRTMLPTLRVFCVSEEPSNLLMWAHYGKDHTGAVFELLSLPEEDNPLSVASRVDYAAVPPPFFALDEWLDDLTGCCDLDHTGLFQRYARTKSDHWAYEKEWRVWWPSKDEGLYLDMPIRSSELASVTLGCRATLEFQNAVKELLSVAFPRAKLYRAKMATSRFGLDVEEV